jgi:DNA processing protein
MSSSVVSQEQELYWLALKLVPGLGTRTSQRLLQQFRTPDAIFGASPSELEAAGLSGTVAQSIARGSTFEEAAVQREKMQQWGAVLAAARTSSIPPRTVN